MDTITKGRLGYNLLEKELLKRDWKIFIPLLENGKIDCIAIKDNQLLRFQIKTIQRDSRGAYLPVRKISHNQGEYKVHLYTADEIDYFIGADLQEECLYICPISFISQYKSSIGQKALQPYKNNFDQLKN